MTSPTGTADQPPVSVPAPVPARRAAVLGHPIGHSLSPALHTAAYRELGLAWEYGQFDCDAAGLPGFVAALGPEWVGLSLTMPLKRVALDVADEVSPLAAAVGAANTLRFGPLGWSADNTDVAGIVGALRSAGVTAIGSVVVLGAGGTAQAALAALRELGQPAPTVVVRDVGRTTELRQAADRLGMAPRIVGGLLDGPLPAADVVISTLPPGATDGVQLGGVQLGGPDSGGPDSGGPGSGGADSGATGPRRAARVVLDVVYAPWPTPLAEAAGARGATVVSGLSVLLYQAIAQVELMTGRPAPAAAMARALTEAVAAPGGRR